ncbi:alpha/beta fold hydrolase [Candidatus Viridilinea mediisalina]|uniref:Alpha/beta hydrolase n=1 Tax=Candidatus Viridilinea mediisalina TaxID=2024553 RepID=A0A2A6RFA2_9CHLR|nr:alpha/beta hydrolase [Candidatus Viridilinea mediisalina]PDW01558.1 alpha/beta hydrolase [Candidatus Viridilinea mediisalina]
MFRRSKQHAIAAPLAPIRVGYYAPLELSYLHAGDHGHPVVMLHGWGAFKELWWPTLRGLGRDYRCFALDLPGHGDSALGRAATLVALAQTVADFCDAFGLKPMTLMGHSMGGAVAAELALLRPDLVSHLVLVDAAVDAYRMPFYARTYMLPTFGWALLRVSQALGRAARPLSTQVPHEHGGGWLRPWLRRNAYLSIFEPEGLHRLYRSLFATRTGARLAHLSMPTLVISGQFDSLVPTAHSRRIARLIAGARYAEIPGALHNPMDERPVAFEQVVRSFLPQRDSFRALYRSEAFSAS